MSVTHCYQQLNCVIINNLNEKNHCQDSFCIYRIDIIPYRRGDSETAGERSSYLLPLPQPGFEPRTFELAKQ